MHLFESRRQPCTVPPPPLEFASQAFLVDVICRWLDPRWRFTHMPAGEYRDPVTAGRLQRLGVVAGWPDPQFAGPERQMVFLELKRRGSGRLSAAQGAIRDHLVACGFAYLCTDSVEVAIGWLKSRGIQRGAVVMIG